MLLLLLLPLLLGVFKMTFEISRLVYQRQKMREQCFTAALKKNDLAKINCGAETQ